MECYCYLRDAQDLLEDRKTPYERLVGEPFKGPVILSGAMVEYPISSRDQSRLHQLGKKKCYWEYSSNVRLIAGVIWKGEIFWLQI